jgi:HlyD family secretion protein
MTMKKKIVLSAAGLIVVGIAAFLIFGNSKSSGDNELPKVKVSRGTVIDKALAVGTIEPENEISIKSKVSGVVSRIFTDVGVYVRMGQPLLEVRPDPTPLELADAKRQVQLSQVELDNLKKEQVREQSLFKNKMISAKDYEDFQRQFEESKLHVIIATEKLALMESGKVKIGDTKSNRLSKHPSPDSY